MDGSDLVAKSLKSAVRGETSGANLTTMIRSSVAKGNHPKTHHWLIIKSHMESSHSSTNLPRLRLYVSLCICSINSIAEECLGYSPIFSHLTLAAFLVFDAEDWSNLGYMRPMRCASEDQCVFSLHVGRVRIRKSDARVRSQFEAPLLWSVIKSFQYWNSKIATDSKNLVPSVGDITGLTCYNWYNWMTERGLSSTWL